MDAGGVDRRETLHRSIVIWVGLFVLTVAALVSAVGILNRELFSASTFVRLYLEALAEHDVAGALATPGVALTSGDAAGTGEAALVTPDALGGLMGITEVSDTEIIPGRHRIVYSYTLTGTGDQQVEGQTEFDVVQTGTSWLVFPEWEFLRSPSARADVTVSHASTFTAGTVQVAAGDAGAFRANRSYDLLVPSLTVLGHTSHYLGAYPSKLVATSTGSSVSAIVDVQPTTRFLDEVQTTVHDFLAECATETLLYPPGCPFGLEVDDRIVTEPAWSIETFPALTIIAGQDSWVVPTASGSAHVRVDIRSLFDGTVTAIDRSIPYDVTFALSIRADGSIQFAPRG
ncbi:hypothetical protein NVV95_14910 [Herbiconiux sp. CPCC 205716]|uniref:Uncharacterized protein n=1 Tax=Herbiconiux gentiana TaxID=2970912 RepID=A0ABT2GI45_9MICO|nr:hypothetical protein [Herbiconiux gentiana]MCS5715838.1 hypothetical protein [Herbiconiux gentiana]